MIGYIQETDPGQPHLVNIKTLNRFFSGQMVEQITASDINAYKRSRKAEGISDSTIRRELTVLGSAINYARREWEWDLEDPTAGRRPKASPGKLR